MTWELAYTAQGDSEAMVIESVLEGEGLEVKTAKESIGRLDAITVGSLGEVKIYVKADMLERAKEVLNDMKVK